MWEYFGKEDHRGYFWVIIVLIIILLILWCILKQQMEDEHRGIITAVNGGPWIIDDTKCPGQHHGDNPNWLQPGDEVYLNPLKVMRGSTERDFFEDFEFYDKIGAKTWYKFAETADGAPGTHDHCVLFHVDGDRLKIYAQEVGPLDRCGQHPTDEYPTAAEIAKIDGGTCTKPHEGGWQGGP